MSDVHRPGREIHELLDEACQIHLLGDDGANDADHERFQQLATEIRGYGMAGAEVCWHLFREGGPVERATAADLLGRLVDNASPEVRERCLGYLLCAVDLELAGASEPDVLSCLASSTGRCEDIRGLPALLKLADHPSEDVRFGVASTIPITCDCQPIPEAVDCLVALSRDLDSDVRDWACFGLGQLHADSPSVRDALADRLVDPDTETRGEALVSLSQLGDSRAYARLARCVDAAEVLELEAAAALGDERLHAGLQRARAVRFAAEPDEEAIARFDFAVRRCDPDAHRRARELEARLVADLAASSTGAGLEITALGSYPHTHLVVIAGGGETRLDAAIWEEDQEPASFVLEHQRDWYLKVLAGEVD